MVSTFGKLRLPPNPSNTSGCCPNVVEGGGDALVIQSSCGTRIVDLAVCHTTVLTCWAILMVREERLKIASTPIFDLARPLAWQAACVLATCPA